VARSRTLFWRYRISFLGDCKVTKKVFVGVKMSFGEAFFSTSRAVVLNHAVYIQKVTRSYSDF